MSEKRIAFDFLCLEDDWPVYRCENDGAFYFLVPRSTSYWFKEVIHSELVERYERIAEEHVSRGKEG